MKRQPAQITIATEAAMSSLRPWCVYGLFNTTGSDLDGHSKFEQRPGRSPGG